MPERICYIEENLDGDIYEINSGFLIKTFEKEGIPYAEIREDVDKYRPEHFHDIPLENVRRNCENDYIDTLEHIIGIASDKLEDIWYDFEEIE